MNVIQALSENACMLSFLLLVTTICICLVIMAVRDKL